MASPYVHLDLFNRLGAGSKVHQLYNPDFTDTEVLAIRKSDWDLGKYDPAPSPPRRHVHRVCSHRKKIRGRQAYCLMRRIAR